MYLVVGYNTFSCNQPKQFSDLVNLVETANNGGWLSPQAYFRPAQAEEVVVEHPSA